MLGDTCFNEESYEKIVEISKAVDNLNYIPGNHDTDKPYRNELYKKMIVDGLLHKTGSLFKLGDFWLSHAPIHPTELRGRYNIHGHTHYVHMTLPVENPHTGLIEQVKDPRYVNVCAENIGYTPINYQMLKNTLTN